MSSKNSPAEPRKVKEQSIPTTYLPDGRVDVPLPELDEKQKAAIAELKTRIEAATAERNIDERYAHPVDYDYLRFLRARKWNVGDAFKMMIATLEWRNINKPDLITEAEIESENMKGKVYFQDYDFDGNLICWIKGFRHVRPDCPGTCVLFDMKGFGFANMDYKYVKFIVDMFANHYPDTLGVAAIVNSPWIFNGCWYIIKPWIDPVTASKVKFVSEKDLLNMIPKSSLPTDLGGESTYDFAASYVPVAQRQPTAESSSTPALTTKEDDSLSSSASTSEKRTEKRKKKSKKSGEASGIATPIPTQVTPSSPEPVAE